MSEQLINEKTVVRGVAAGLLINIEIILYSIQQNLCMSIVLNTVMNLNETNIKILVRVISRENYL